MNDISKRNATQAAALSEDFVAKLVSGIAESQASTILKTGKPYLRLLKSGEWVFGPRDEPVQEGSNWALNPASILHGWVCWSNDPSASKNEKLGEVVEPIFHPKPPKPDPIRGFPFSELRIMDLKCLDGDDKDVEVVYALSSLGGMNAFADLVGKIKQQLLADRLHPCPVLQLQADWYNNAKYGRTYVPILTLTGWATMLGELAPEAEKIAPKEPVKPAKPAAPAEPARKTKAPLNQPAAEAPAQPAPTAALRTPGTPRRRPAAA